MSPRNTLSTDSETEPSLTPRHYETQKETPFYGCLAGIIAQSAGASYAISTKALFDRHDNMHPMQMAAIRSIISCLILLVVLNKRIKYVMWDNISKDVSKSLAVKVIQNCVGVSSVLVAQKYLSLTTVCMIFNCAPFLVIISAYFVLNEKTNILEFWATAIAVIGASFLVFGANHATEEAAGKQ